MNASWSSPLRAWPAIAAALAGWVTPGPLASQVQPRFAVETPMRDGTVLVSDLWMPEGEGPFPTILVRIPYERTLEIIGGNRSPELGEYFASNGYVWMIQDTRGRGDSEGTFRFFHDDAEDGYDTIEWIAAQPWSDGGVCMMGASYMGTVQWLAARERPPHLRCIAPAAAAGRWFDEVPYIGGALQMRFMLAWTFGTSGRTQKNAQLTGIDWERVFRHRPLLTMDETLGRRIPIWREFVTHDHRDEYWEPLQFVAPRDFTGLDVPALHIAGLFDWDQPGALFYWRGMAAHSPARDHQFLLLGPWTHPQTWTGGATTLGEWRFDDEAVVDYKPVYLAFFDGYLRGSADSFDMPRARVYLTGANRWEDFDAWPPAGVETRRFYLHSGGRANASVDDGSLDEAVPGDEPPDRYVHDPRDLVPSGPLDRDPRGIDHRSIESRDDVLVYTTDPLQDTVTVLGRVFVTLTAATDARDTDWTAKLLDVHPDGRALKLGPTEVGVIRARYREGYEASRLVVPGDVVEYRIELFDVAHAFLPGHRIRLEVASAAFPFIDVNTNTGNPVGTDTAWVVANQTVFHDGGRLSFVELPVRGR